MFVVTENSKLINLAFYRSVEVQEDPRNSSKYQVVAYVKASSGMQMDGADLDVICTRDTKKEAVIEFEGIARASGCKADFRRRATNV